MARTRSAIERGNCSGHFWMACLLTPRRPAASATDPPRSAIAVSFFIPDSSNLFSENSFGAGNFFSATVQIAPSMRAHASTCEHMTTLLERLEIALSRAGETRTRLAEAIGVKRQSLYPEGSMAGDTLAKAAHFLRCDLYWLCTGEGGIYVPECSLAAKVASMVERMTPENQLKIFEMAVHLSPGRPSEGAKGRSEKPTAHKDLTRRDK